ncbi:MAG TPA: hypothetical protein V6C97_00750 [Oculatellaceae cyanobacterium]
MEGGMAQTQSSLKNAKNHLAQNIERLGAVDDKAEGLRFFRRFSFDSVCSSIEPELSRDATNFAEMARKLAEQEKQNSSWFGFF